MSWRSYGSDPLDVIWPLGTTWAETDRTVVLGDGTRLADGTTLATGGGALALTADDVRPADRWIDQSTVDDDSVGCLVHDDVWVMGAFEAVLDA